MSYSAILDETNYYAGATTSPRIERVPVEAGNTEATQLLPQLKALLGIDESIKDFDTQLLTFLATAYDDVENYTSRALQPQLVTVFYSGYDGATVPFGPVWTDPVPVLTPTASGSSITINDVTGTALSEGQFPVIEGSFSEGKVTYKAGYSNLQNAIYPLPEGLKGAILEHAATAYRSAGISGQKPSVYWKSLAAKYRRF